MGGGTDSRGGYVPKILYVETKESGPLDGRANDFGVEKTESFTSREGEQLLSNYS